MTPIVYFDGLCNLCDGFARFVLARRGGDRLRYAPLQGETARARLGARFGAEPHTIVLEQVDRFRVRSDAAIAILSGLGGVWRLAEILRIVPRPLRDAVYDAIARRRFRWWGRREACRVPTAEERERFLP